MCYVDISIKIVVMEELAPVYTYSTTCCMTADTNLILPVVSLTDILGTVKSRQRALHSFLFTA